MGFPIGGGLPMGGPPLRPPAKRPMIAPPSRPSVSDGDADDMPTASRLPRSKGARKAGRAAFGRGGGGKRF